jgi:hypothetical protein
MVQVKILLRTPVSDKWASNMGELDGVCEMSSFEAADREIRRILPTHYSESTPLFSWGRETTYFVGNGGERVLAATITEPAPTGT